jgi:hypothetical protein
MNRYNQEIQMVRQLQELIRQTEEQAYQFAVNIAQRINSVGGHENVAGIALGRAGDLRNRVETSGEPTGMAIDDVNSYVGAIDTWYQSRREEILKQMDAEKQASQAIINAQTAAAQARVQQLQDELAMVQQFQGVVDRTQQMLE